MKRIILGALAGGLTLHIWSVLAWMVLPLHDQTMAPLKNEETIVAALREQGLAEGAYYAPYMPSSRDNPLTVDMDAKYKSFEKKHQAGPIFLVLYNPNGSEVMPPTTMAAGFGIDVFLALLLSSVLWIVRDSVPDLLSRIQIVALVAVFAGIASYGQAWNWMGFTGKFVRDMILEVFVGWMIAGTVVALIVKRTAGAATTP